jgi:hypothetical protein
MKQNKIILFEMQKLNAFGDKCKIEPLAKAH